MAGRFVRASKYRHIFGKPTRKEYCYDNLSISRNAWDSNLVKANPEYLAVNWESSGGGAFAVIPLGERGKLPDQMPLFRGHTSAVLDTDWNPFNDNVIASASDDGKVFLWQVPQGFTLYTEEGVEEVADVSPVAKLTGHTRKVGQVLFNPAAENVLASASGDLTVKFWDVGGGASHQALRSVRHPDMVQSLSWSADGSMLVTTSRDKKLRVWDVRQERAAHEHPGHEGAKNSRAVWMGEHNRVATTGFSRMSDRQIGLWEPGRKDPIGGFTSLDSISGVCMPFWDDGSNCLYLAGKGDGNIRYFEYENDKFEFLSEYKSGEPQRGIAFLPRRGINLHENEVMRAYKTVSDSYIEPISFTVPRRAETFQSDIYPPAFGLKPAVSAKEWLDGKTGVPPKIDLESIYDGNEPVQVASDFKAAPQQTTTPAPIAKAKDAEPARPAPAAAAAARAPRPQVADQKSSISAMAHKYQDHEEENQDAVDEEAETSSFEEVSRPGPRNTKVPVRAASPAKRPSSPIKRVPAGRRSPERTAVSTATRQDHGETTGKTESVEHSLQQIKQLLEQQTRIIATQSDQITAQSDTIGRLAAEVETLKKRVGTAPQDQSERIRQLELELEAARS